MYSTRRFLSFALACGLVLTCTSAFAAGTTAIVNARIVPLDREAVLENRVVVVRDGKIESLVPRGEYTTGKDVTVIDAGGAWLLPGLADMHAHVRLDPERTFRLFLANGVTTVRNMDYLDGGLDHVALRDRIAAGEILGPRYLLTGPVLNPATLPNVESVAPLLRKHVDRGIEYVKIHADLSPPVYDALIRQSAELGLTVVGHAQRQQPLAETLRLYSVAHAEEFIYVLGRDTLGDDARRQAAVRTIAESGIWLSPTLVVYATILDYVVPERWNALPARPALQYLPADERALWLSPEQNEYRQQNFSAARIERTRSGLRLLEQLTLDLHRAGVRMILGADGFGAVVPGFSVADELEELVHVGLTPYEALRTATANVAEYLHEPGNGIVAPGAVADLVLVGGNPLADIGAVRDVRGVMVRGTWISGEERDRLLAEIREAYAGPARSKEKE